jgi:hypothetical protein
MLQKTFLEDMGLLIVKTKLSIYFMENVWLNCLIFHLCSIINFFSRRHFLQEILPRLVEKTKQFYVLSRLVECHSTIISFDF